jgi:hypothetical protein
MDCKNTNIDQTTLKNDLKNNLESAVKTVKDTPFFSFGDQAIATSVNKSLNEITNDVNIEKISESILKSLQDQNIAINISEYRCFPYKTKSGEIVGTELNIQNLNQDILNNVVLNALTENQNIVDAVTTIDNAMKNKAEATSLGLSMLAFIWIIPIIIFFIIMFFVARRVTGMFSRGAKSASKQASQFMNNPIAVNNAGNLATQLGTAFNLATTQIPVAQAVAQSSQQNKSARFGSSDTKKTNVPMILFGIYLLFAMGIALFMVVNIELVKPFSESLPKYYGLLVLYFLFTTITSVVFILYLKSESSVKLAFIIIGIIFSIGIASMCIALTQIEINEFNAMLKDYSTNSNDLMSQ